MRRLPVPVVAVLLFLHGRCVATPEIEEIEGWVARLGSESSEERESAQRELQERGYPEGGLAVVVRACRSEDPEIAWRAGRVLAARGWPTVDMIAASEAAGADGLPLWLLVVTSPEAGMDLVRAAAAAIGRVDPGEGVPALVAAFEGGDEQGRYRIAVALGEIPGEGAVGALATLQARTDLTVAQQFALAGSLVRQGRPAAWEALVESTRREAATGESGPIPVYNLACLHALAGRTEEALGFLAQAVDSGFHDYVWMGRDPDLASLHGIPRFDELRERARTLARGE